MTIADAARRCAFTINAIAFDPLTGEYLDPFHRRTELDHRLLSVVGPAYSPEDRLRVLRHVQ